MSNQSSGVVEIPVLTYLNGDKLVKCNVQVNYVFSYSGPIDEATAKLGIETTIKAAIAKDCFTGITEQEAMLCVIKHMNEINSQTRQIFSAARANLDSLGIKSVKIVPRNGDSRSTAAAPAKWTCKYCGCINEGAATTCPHCLGTK